MKDLGVDEGIRDTGREHTAPALGCECPTAAVYVRGGVDAQELAAGQESRY
jgi:hypothetical protein